MLRRFNYTNRKRISREDVSVAVRRGSAEVFFDADLSLLTTYGFDKECRVFVEAYRQTTWTRFDFGLIGAIEPPADRSLGRFGVMDGIHFRIKVTDPASNHRLVAEADGIPLKESDNVTSPAESLLRIVQTNLQFEIYRLSLDDYGPILEISKDAGDKTGIAKDPAFAALVYPTVLKEILTRILLIEKYDDIENLDLWQSQWLQFATNLGGMVSPPEGDDTEAQESWIEDAVTAFARQTHVAEQFAKHREDQK